MPITFAQLEASWTWRPIPGCPGRFVLRGHPRDLSVEGLTGPAEVQSFHVPAARDPVQVVAIDGGGVISYVREDGTYVHTLNTEAGFQRKLDQLGIRLAR